MLLEIMGPSHIIMLLFLLGFLTCYVLAFVRVARGNLSFLSRLIYIILLIILPAIGAIYVFMSIPRRRKKKTFNPNLDVIDEE